MPSPPHNLRREITLIRTYVTDLLAQTEAAGRAVDRARSLLADAAAGRDRSRELASALFHLNSVLTELCENADEVQSRAARTMAAALAPGPGDAGPGSGSTHGPCP